jgi:hypothetical protein
MEIPAGSVFGTNAPLPVMMRRDDLDIGQAGLQGRELDGDDRGRRDRGRDEFGSRDRLPGDVRRARDPRGDRLGG